MFKNEKEKKSSLVKVFFFLNQSDWHGYESESVWAEKLSSNQCQLRNTPFFAKGVSFEDIVIVRPENETLIFDSVSIHTGHSTYRVIVDSNVPKSTFDKYWRPLSFLGCTYESTNNAQLLLAIDVPPKADIYEVYSLLEKGESDNVWGFEEGHCGHPLK